MTQKEPTEEIKEPTDIQTEETEERTKNLQNKSAADTKKGSNKEDDETHEKTPNKRRKVLMRFIIGVGVFLALFQLAVFYDTKIKDAPSEEYEELMSMLTGEEVGIHTGNLAPNMDLVDMETYEVKQLADFKGKTILLNFWASWCEPCKSEMPDIERIYNEYKDEVAVISVNMTTHEKSDKNPLRFLIDNKLTFPVYQDVGGMNSQLYQIKPIPTTFIINADGMITGVYPHYLTYEQMVEALDFAKFTNEHKKEKK